MASLRPVFELIGLKISAVFGAMSPLGKARFLVWTLLLCGLFWSGAMLLTSTISDQPAFGEELLAESPTGARSSRAVLTAAALIEREVVQHPWVANDPFFLPGHYLDNMPNFQQGIVYALSRFTVLLADQIGRARGSSQVDPDLDTAVGLLKYPGDVWVFNTKTSLMPTASSEAQYRAARKALLNYNQRLGDGKAVFDPRSDNLIATLDSIAGDLGSQSAIIEAYLHEGRFWLLEGHADDIFYSTKGRLYAYFLVLRAMGQDYAQLIRDRDLTNVWNNMIQSFAEAIALQPLVIVSGAPDSQFLPSHLASQGFFVLRARTNLREITSILSK
jgi:hypothetical protein